MLAWFQCRRIQLGELMKPARSVPAAVREIVLAHPNETAIIDRGAKVTYQALWHASGHVAQMLIERGVSPGNRVGLRLARGSGAIAAMLGVLRAAATFVPLDDADPLVRQRLIVDGADLSVTLVDAHHRDGDGGGDTICLEEPICLKDTSGAITATRHEGDGGARFPMSIMFTSGSTGTPKGVVVEHAGVLALVADRRFGFTGNTVMSHMSSLAFDASTLEIWGPLCHGGTVVVLDLLDLLGDPDNLACLALHSVNSLWLTTALFHYLAQHRAEAMFGLERVFFGGEKADPSCVAAWLRRRGESAFPLLLNCYGPTEATVIATVAELGVNGGGRPEDLLADVPIGQPLDHVSAVLVDDDLRVCADGESGELLLLGAGLAAGYWRDGASTDAKFIGVDFGDGLRGRAYRTGDLCAWRGDTLHFLGRTDDLVKLRGHRIDLGEVEHALRRVDGVRDARVVFVGSGKDQRLVGFFSADPSTTARAVRRALLELLPAYMVPLDLRRLEELPLLPSGKTDLTTLRTLANRV